MVDQLHNLDENISEYFEFLLFGHKYKYPYLTTEQLDQLRKLIKTTSKIEADEKVQTFIFSFVSPAQPESPDFKKVYKKMTIAHLKRFMNMIKSEFGISEDEDTG